MTPARDVLTEMILFSLGRRDKKGADTVARRLSSLEMAVRSMGQNNCSGDDDYGFYL